MTFLVQWPEGGGYSWRCNLRRFLTDWQKQRHIAGFDMEVLDFLLAKGKSTWPEEYYAEKVPHFWQKMPRVKDLKEKYDSANNHAQRNVESLQIRESSSCQINRDGLEVELLFFVEGHLLNRWKPDIIAPKFLVFNSRLIILSKKIRVFDHEGECIQKGERWGLDEDWIEVQNLREHNGTLIAAYSNRNTGPSQPMKETYLQSGKSGLIQLDENAVPMGFFPLEPG